MPLGLATDFTAASFGRVTEADRPRPRVDRGDRARRGRRASLWCASRSSTPPRGRGFRRRSSPHGRQPKLKGVAPCRLNPKNSNARTIKFTTPILLTSQRIPIYFCCCNTSREEEVVHGPGKQQCSNVGPNEFNKKGASYRYLPITDANYRLQP